MVDKKHLDGDVCEVLAAEHFIRLGYWIYPAIQTHSPIDLVIVNAEGPRLIQVKKDAGRVNPGRSKNTRIHRVRTELQKALGVEFVYVDMNTRKVFVTDHDYHANRSKPTDF